MTSLLYLLPRHCLFFFLTSRGRLGPPQKKRETLSFLPQRLLFCSSLNLVCHDSCPHLGGCQLPWEISQVSWKRHYLYLQLQMSIYLLSLFALSLALALGPNPKASEIVICGSPQPGTLCPPAASTLNK